MLEAKKTAEECLRRLNPSDAQRRERENKIEELRRQAAEFGFELKKTT